MKFLIYFCLLKKCNCMCIRCRCWGFKDYLMILRFYRLVTECKRSTTTCYEFYSVSVCAKYFICKLP